MIYFSWTTEYIDVYVRKLPGIQDFTNNFFQFIYKVNQVQKSLHMGSQRVSWRRGITFPSKFYGSDERGYHLTKQKSHI